jgi:hypothetical protein
MRKETFHLDGRVPVERDKLKMCKRGDFNTSAKSLTNEEGTPSFSGPWLTSRPEIAASKLDLRRISFSLNSLQPTLVHCFELYIYHAINILDNSQNSNKSRKR